MMNIMNMNQMNFMNSNMNQNNNAAQVNFNNSVDLKGIKKELIDQIILFYQLKGKDYMHYGNPKQIEGLITHLTYKPSESLELNEPLSYIEGPTVIINFIFRYRNDYYASKYKLPKSISKFELYTIIKPENKVKLNDFLLVHKEAILTKDDSNLESFSDNDNIIIIEDIYYPDDSYYNLFLKRTDEKINILFDCPEIRLNMIFPQSAKIGELLKAFYLRLGIDDKKYFLLFNSQRLLQDDNRSLYEIFSNNSRVIIYSSCNAIGGRITNIFGKIITANIKFREANFIIEIGALNSTKHLIMEFLDHSGKNPNDTDSVKKLIINEVEIKKERSLKSLGISKDFSCYIELKS